MKKVVQDFPDGLLWKVKNREVKISESRKSIFVTTILLLAFSTS